MNHAPLGQRTRSNSLRCPLTRAGASLRIPNLETTGVNLKGSAAVSHQDALYPQLLLRDECVAGVACFPSWTREQSRDLVDRLAPVSKLGPDEDTYCLRVHRDRLSGIGNQGNTRCTGDSASVASSSPWRRRPRRTRDAPPMSASPASSPQSRNTQAGVARIAAVAVLLGSGHATEHEQSASCISPGAQASKAARTLFRPRVCGTHSHRCYCSREKARSTSNVS